MEIVAPTRNKLPEKIIDLTPTTEILEFWNIVSTDQHNVLTATRIQFRQPRQDAVTGPQDAKLSDAEILTRLVALNAARAAEEARGQIRWLRPAYQAPAGQTTQTGLNITTKDTKSTKARPAKAKEPWPKPLAERVAAVERALAASGSPVTPAQLARHFLRAKPEDLAEIFETLPTLGRAHRNGQLFSV